MASGTALKVRLMVYAVSRKFILPQVKNDGAKSGGESGRDEERSKGGGEETKGKRREANDNGKRVMLRMERGTEESKDGRGQEP